MSFRLEDENLLQRLEDEQIVAGLFAVLAGAAAELHSRAGGLVAEIRKLPDGRRAVEAAAGGDMSALVRFVEQRAPKDQAPELIHHVALFHAKVAAALEQTWPDAAAAAWVRSLGAWLALAEERTYLARFEAAMLGPRGAKSDAPERIVFDVVADIAARAEKTARGLGQAGRAALLALARIDEAGVLAGAPPATMGRVRNEAERRRNSAIEAALAVIGEGLDEANVRGELVTTGRMLLLRAVPVWSWTSNDVAVERFVVERIDKIGWELYRKRDWTALRYLLDPFRPMFESLAARIERDPSELAYAAGCAQMFVFLSEVDVLPAQKLALVERAVKICPTHRNGRLVLAAVLCEHALEAMRAMTFFARREELARVETMLARAESLYPQSSDLPEARAMLERVRKGRIAV